MFLLAGLSLTVLFGIPFLGGKIAETIYQLVCVFFLFPLIIWFGGRGIVSGWQQTVVSFLGRLSYPLYAIHYPFVYLYIARLGKDGHPYENYSQPWKPALFTIIFAVVSATVCLVMYDEPLREWLNRKVS